MSKLTLNDIEPQIEGAKWSGDELRGQCPLCGSSTGLAANENGILKIHCHACDASFEKFIDYFSGSLAKDYSSASKPIKPSKPKLTAEQAAKEAHSIWKQSRPADPNQAYLAKKGIEPHGARQEQDGNLIIPARNIYSEITTLQRIFPSGDKRFLLGGTKKGSFFILNEQQIDPNKTTYLCEGFATAASVQKATGKPTICAFDAGNLKPVAEALRQRYSDLKIVICGDDDKFRKDGSLKDNTEENKGRESATATAIAVNGKVCFPSFKSDEGKPTDFNDLHQREGLKIVAAQIKGAMTPPEQEESTSTQDRAAKINARIEKLVHLDPVSQDIERKKIIHECKVTAKTIDAVLASMRKAATEETTAIVADVEPWPEKVNGAKLLSLMSEVFSRYVILPDNMDSVLAVWALLTYCYDQFRILPQIAIYSPEKRCGKSTLLEILHAFVLRGLIASNISSAAVYRTIEKFKPCLFIDEADTFYKENIELQGICNSGHTKKTAFVIRIEGDNHDPVRFSTWGPKVISLIGSLKDTQHDRSIVVPMRRKLPDEQVQKMPFDIEVDYLDIRQQCARWANDNKDKLLSVSPKIPETGNDRQADNWYPLFAIAECVGDSWPEIISKALQGIAEDTDDSDSIAIRLLRDIESIFKSTCMDKISSEEIVESLKKLEDSPWSDWNYGRGLTQNALSRQLRHFKIKPIQQWVNSKNQRGYSLKQFKDTFTRYLSTPEPPVLSARPLEANNYVPFPDFQCDRSKKALALEKQQKATARLGYSTLSLEIGGTDETKTETSKAANSEFMSF